MTTSQQQQQQQQQAAFNEITFNVIIHGGRNLVAKDKTLFGGKKGTSDPFVKVSLLNKTYGQTKVQTKTLAPIWNESFPIKVVGEQQTKQCLTSSIHLNIYDHDNTLLSYKNIVIDFILKEFDRIYI